MSRAQTMTPAQLRILGELFWGRTAYQLDNTLSVYISHRRVCNRVTMEALVRLGYAEEFVPRRWCATTAGEAEYMRLEPTATKLPS